MVLRDLCLYVDAICCFLTKLPELKRENRQQCGSSADRHVLCAEQGSHWSSPQCDTAALLSAHPEQAGSCYSSQRDSQLQTGTAGAALLPPLGIVPVCQRGVKAPGDSSRPSVLQLWWGGKQTRHKAGCPKGGDLFSCQSQAGTKSLTLPLPSAIGPSTAHPFSI